MISVSENPQKVKPLSDPQGCVDAKDKLHQSSNGVLESDNVFIENSEFTYLPEACGVSGDDWCNANELLCELLSRQAPALWRRCQKSPDNSAVRLLRLLLLLALRVAKERGYSTAVSQVVFHLPSELLAAAMRVSRWTVWRKLKELEAAGLVASSCHYDSLDGKAAISGKIWAVRLKPGEAKITFDDLTHNWRDLEADREMGITAYAACQQGQVAFAMLLDWALGQRRSDSEVPLSQELEWLEILPELSVRQAVYYIDRLSASIARVLNDLKSQRYYAGLLWQIARRQLEAQYVKLAFRVARNTLADNWAMSPGAIFVEYLKGC